MRGEDMTGRVLTRSVSGSPPHARGRLRSMNRLRSSFRITPACAGKTSTALSVMRLATDHPRMRGEDG